MPLYLTKKAKLFANHLRKDFLEYESDTYYLCAVMGLAHNECETDHKWTHNEELDQLVAPGAGLPKEYKNSYKILNSLLLCAYLKDEGIQLDNREGVKDAIDYIIDPEHPTRLTPNAQNLLNAYSAGGATILMQMFGEDLTDPSLFVNEYVKKINEKFLV